jgi:hypothetical protein
MKTFGFHSVAVSDVTGFVLRGFILRQKAADVIAGVRHPGRRQSFGVSASERDSPKVCAPGEINELINSLKIFIESVGQNRGHDARQSMMTTRA